eukprot:GHVH01003838.1.p1 GENE.GHVH01003838.1~~GHVH01003838.1.p1  ORF type:complete len:195 (-),score=31.05 GHVH01003838.1:33-617(-)
MSRVKTGSNARDIRYETCFCSTHSFFDPRLPPRCSTDHLVTAGVMNIRHLMTLIYSGLSYSCSSFSHNLTPHLLLPNIHEDSQPLCPCALFIAITSIIALCCVVAVQIMTIYRTANVESLTDTAPHYQLGKIIGEFDNMSIRQIAVQQDDESSFSASFAESVETDGESSDEFEETISSESIRFDDEEYEYDEFD